MKREGEDGSPPPPKRAAVVRLNVGGQHYDTTKDCNDGTYGEPRGPHHNYSIQKVAKSYCLFMFEFFSRQNLI